MPDAYARTPPAGGPWQTRASEDAQPGPADCDYGEQRRPPLECTLGLAMAAVLGAFQRTAWRVRGLSRLFLRGATGCATCRRLSLHVREMCRRRRCRALVLFEAVALLEGGAAPLFSVPDTQTLLARLHEAVAAGGGDSTNGGGGGGGGGCGSSAATARLQVVRLALARNLSRAFLHQVEVAPEGSMGRREYCVY